MVHHPTFLGANTTTADTLHLIRFFHIRILGNYLPRPGFGTGLYQSQSFRQGSAKNISDTNVCHQLIRRLLSNQWACTSPESQGLVCASIYILLLMLFIPFAFSDAILGLVSNSHNEGISIREFPHYQVCRLFSCLSLLLLSYPKDSISLQCTYLLFSRCLLPLCSGS